MPDSFTTSPPGTPQSWGEAFAALPTESPSEDLRARVTRALDARTPHTRAKPRERRDWLIALASAAVLALVIWGPMGWQPPTSRGSSAAAIHATKASSESLAAVTPAVRLPSGEAPASDALDHADESALLSKAPRVDRQRAREATDRLVASLQRGTQASTIAQTTADPLLQLQSQSAQLEALLGVARDDRVSSALGVALTSEIDGRISLIDAALSQTDLPDAQRHALWQQRVDALRELAGIESTERLLAARGEHLDGTLVTVN